jgi:hypothetical protein
LRKQTSLGSLPRCVRFFLRLEFVGAGRGVTEPANVGVASEKRFAQRKYQRDANEHRKKEIHSFSNQDDFDDVEQCVGIRNRRAWR